LNHIIEFTVVKYLLVNKVVSGNNND
jgi:hypothetical protein